MTNNATPATVGKEDLLSLWHHTLTTHRPDGRAIGICAAFFFASSLLLPLAQNQSFAVALCLAAVFFVYSLTHSFLSLLGFGAPLLFLSSYSFTLPAAFAAIVVGGACGAFLLLHYHNGKQLIPVAALPVAAYVFAAAVLRTPVQAALSLLPVVAAVLLFLCLYNYCSQNDSILYLSLGLGTALLIAGLVTLFLTRDGFSLSQLPAMADELRAAMVQYLLEAERAYAAAGGMGLSPTDVSNLAIMMVNLLPALAMLSMMAMALLCWRTLLRSVVAFGTVRRLGVSLVAFRASGTKALVFLIVFFITLFSGAAEVTFFGTVMQNLYLVMQPLFIILGIGIMVSPVAQRSCLQSLLSIGILALLWVSPSSALTATSLLGAGYTLIAPFAPSRPKEKGD